MKRPIMTFTLVLAVILNISAQSTNSIITSDYVGIGIDHPAYRLHLFENSSNHMYLNFSNLTTGNNNGDGVLVGIDLNEDFRIHSYEDNDLRFYINNEFRMILKNSGRLGLGVEDPLAKLHIVENLATEATLRLQATGSANSSVIEFFKNTQGMSLHYDGADNNLYVTSENPQKTRVAFHGDEGLIGIYNNSAAQTILLKGAETETTGAEIILKNAGGVDMIELDGEGFGNAGHIRLYDNDGTQTMVLKGAETETTGAEISLNNANGDPTIELDGEGYGNAGHISLYDNDQTETLILTSAQNVDDGAAITMRNANGDQTILLDADHVGTNGRGRVITDELEIEGGADLSEYFDIDNTTGIEILLGMVVSISPDGSGSLRLSTKGYDKTVAGVISGANGVRTGLMMGQESSIAHGDTPVVLAGRAYVWADATFGAIQPGDLLTTSNTPGHVMKARDYRKAQGAILGKAMTELEEGRGYVLVLVNLH